MRKIRLKTQNSKLKAGFTLIELLVVIAVISVLAVAVLSSINPVEQINKAKDTASKSDSTEYLNGLERYFSTFGCYPWDNGNNGTGSNPCPAAPVGLTPTAVGSLNTTTTAELVAKNEIKTEFRTRISSQTVATNKNVLIVSDADPSGENLVHICFLPSSKTFQAKAKLGNNGAGTGSHFCTPGSD